MSTTDVCTWKYDPDGYWEGTCGIAFSLDDGTPHENDMNYCPKCGKPLVEDGIFDVDQAAQDAHDLAKVIYAEKSE